MTAVSDDGRAKPATAARIYDYHLGGIHNFPADREVAEKMVKMFPQVPAITRAGRAYLRRVVAYLVAQGIRQFLDIGSGIPTQGNVHEVAQALAPDSRVVYLDIDPVAVSESIDILDGNPTATALWGDLRDPQAILDNPQVRELIDFSQPLGLLLVAVLHFVPDDEQADDVVARLTSALAPGSYVAITHVTLDDQDLDEGHVAQTKDLYQQRTATPLGLRTREQVAGFFQGLELVEPGLTWAPAWRPDPDEPGEFADNPAASVILAGVARKPR
ncbi:MAG TPA: SAM-dependent methyltransferase [Micromonosporaceae bacterium]